MIRDKYYNELKIGDKVRYTSVNITYEFTIEEIDNGGWIWGSDMTEEHRYCFDGDKNYHNPLACGKIENKPKKPWDGSKIKFHLV